MDEDPELERVAELLAVERAGRLVAGELEELAIYREEQPELVAAASEGVARRTRLAPEGVDDGAWLERIRAEQALTAAEKAPRSRGERALGLALVVGGWGVSLLFGTLTGSVMTIAGIALLLLSFLRVRLGGRDPYDRIKQ